MILLEMEKEFKDQKKDIIEQDENHEEEGNRNYKI